MKVTIIPHPKYPKTHQLVKVESRGRVYAIEWAEPFPSEAEVYEIWRTDRDLFRPFDESTGTFLD